jgi:hypothetical protein
VYDLARDSNKYRIEAGMVKKGKENKNTWEKQVKME